MGLLSGALGSNQNMVETGKSEYSDRQRTFKETIQDKIAFHKSKVDDLQSLIDSMSPEVEKFVEALQKSSL